MSSTSRLTPEAACDSLNGVACASRRRLLALFATVLAALGLYPLTAPDLADAKKGKHKNKKKKKRRKKNGGCQQRDTSYTPESEEEALIDLINDFRARNGKGSLVMHERLGAAAKHHSQDMANKNYFAHKLSNGASPEENIRCHGYSYRTFGENIAAGFESAEDTFAQWENSSGHRKIMLGNYAEIGVGRAHNANARYDWYWTANFGSR